MNILLQLWCCDPKRGGEFATAWSWLTELRKKLRKEDQLYILSGSLDQDMLNRQRWQNVHLIEVWGRDINGIFRNGFDHVSILDYRRWQKRAYQIVRKMNIHFDVIHLYSASDFRHPGQWSRFRNAYTIFGPVGGGQSCPRALCRYGDWKSIYLREMLNRLNMLNPCWRFAVGRYQKIYAANYETAAYMKGAETLIDIPLNRAFQDLTIPERCNEKTVILFCGRLIKKKGVHLLLDIAEKMPKEVPFEIHIYGDGPERAAMEERIMQSTLKEKVFLKGFVSYQKMTEVYRNADIFVLPSLRESGGSVLIEAMANALPIVSLNLAISAILKEKNAGIFIDTSLTQEGIVNAFAEALVALIQQPERRRALGMNGYTFVNRELNWDAMVERVYGTLLK